MTSSRIPTRYTLAGAVAAVALMAGSAGGAYASPMSTARHRPSPTTATPIKHLVVIFQENVSFDHYFGTYPQAANTDGQHFVAKRDTPTVNGLSQPLLTDNPNLSNPQRLSPSQAATCDQDHGYTAEQKAFDNGLMDRFVQNTGRALTLQQCLAAEANPAPATGSSPDYAVMDYFDGNTVTALWNYAQHFAMSDNSYGTTFGPSSPGAVNVTAGNTYGAICGPSSAVYKSRPCTGAAGSVRANPAEPAPQGPGTMYSDADPYYDVCSATQDGKSAPADIQMGGRNIGDLLDHKGVSWGWFQGGFASPSYVPGQPNSDKMVAVCTGTHTNVLGHSVKDYSPHHEPFQYYPSTANPQHLPPTSVTAIGTQDQANHQYDLKDFFAAADARNMPAVSYLKAPEYQDGHAGYSDPLDEQTFLTSAINHLQRLPTWKDTAVVVSYDDSDGWYDHQMGPVLMQSQTPLDSLTGTAVAPTTMVPVVASATTSGPVVASATTSGQCGANASKVATTDAGAPEEARCGVGPRLPLLVISPYSRRNFVDNSFSSQSSVVAFIEDNWLGGQRIGNGSADAMGGSLTTMLDFTHSREPRLFLDSSTGQPTGG